MAYSNLYFFPRWKMQGTQSNIAWDVEGYYWYLPSVFIYNDLKKQSFKDEISEKYHSSGSDKFEHGFIHQKTGNYVLKYSSGMAFLYSPAFFCGHIFAKVLKYPQDGFSPPYKLAFQIWGLLFSFLGLFYLRKLLKLFYKDNIVALVLLLLVIGTNYLNYGAIDIGMSHSWLFTIYVFIILNSHFFYTTSKSKYLIRIGFLVGLSVLIRPTEIITMLIPILWGIENLKGLKERFVFIFKRKGLFVLTAICALSIISIQLSYWKYVSDEWFVYSYQNQGFSFLDPHSFNYSWSYRSGWLRYSPMMILSFIGLVLYWKKGKNKVAIISIFLLNYYIVSAWDIWDYGGFGGRAMLQSYPILVFPIATLLEFVFQKKWATITIIPILLLFIYLNIWFTYQAHKGSLLDSSCATRAYYWKTVGRWSVPEDYQKLKDTKELYEGNPKSQKSIYTHSLADSGDYCISLNHPTTPPIVFSGKSISGKWIRTEADFYCFKKEWDVWHMPQLSVQFMKNGKEVKGCFIRVGRFLEDNQSRRLFMDMKVPAETFDSVKIILINFDSDKTNCMSKLEVSEFDS